MWWVVTKSLVGVLKQLGISSKKIRPGKILFSNTPYQAKLTSIVLPSYILYCLSSWKKSCLRRLFITSAASRFYSYLFWTKFHAICLNLLNYLKSSNYLFENHFLISCFQGNISHLMAVKLIINFYHKLLRVYGGWVFVLLKLIVTFIYKLLP